MSRLERVVCHVEDNDVVEVKRGVWKERITIGSVQLVVTPSVLVKIGQAIQDFVDSRVWPVVNPLEKDKQRLDKLQELVEQSAVEFSHGTSMAEQDGPFLVETKSGWGSGSGIREAIDVLGEVE